MWLMVVKRIESRLGKTEPKPADCWLMETNVSTEIYDGPSFFTMPSNYLHRPVVIIPITAKTEKSVTHRPGTRWRQGQSSMDQYFIYSVRLASIPVSNSFTESHERNEVCCKTPIQRPCFLGVLRKEAAQQSLSGKQYALKVAHCSPLLENKVPLAWCGDVHQSTAYQKKCVFNLVVLLGMNEPFEHRLHNLTIVKKIFLLTGNHLFKK